jgi:hypothetical protein
MINSNAPRDPDDLYFKVKVSRHIPGNPAESGLKLELTVRVPIDSAKLLTEEKVSPTHPKIIQRVKNAACDAIITPGFTVTEQAIDATTAPPRGYVSKMEFQDDDGTQVWL